MRPTHLPALPLVRPQQGFKDEFEERLAAYLGHQIRSDTSVVCELQAPGCGPSCVLPCPQRSSCCSRLHAWKARLGAAHKAGKHHYSPGHAPADGDGFRLAHEAFQLHGLAPLVQHVRQTGAFPAH